MKTMMFSKKALVLLALAMLTSQFVGCGCCRRLRDRLCRGAYCGSSAVTPPAFATQGMQGPAPMLIPQMQSAAPMMIPQQSVSCEPCQPMMCEPCCETYGYGGAEMGYSGAPVMDSGWSSGCDSCQGGSSIEGVISGDSGGIVLPGPAQ